MILFIFHRKEHNIAMLQMKTILQFRPDSKYLPVCLPPQCDHTCRTWGGQTRDEIIGEDGFFMDFGYGTITKFKLINEEKCKVIRDFQNTLSVRRIRRLKMPVCL